MHTKYLIYKSKSFNKLVLRPASLGSSPSSSSPPAPPGLFRAVLKNLPEQIRQSAFSGSFRKNGGLLAPLSGLVLLLGVVRFPAGVGIGAIGVGACVDVSMVALLLRDLG